MTNPVLMVVDGNPASLATLDGALRHRYEHDYLIISEATTATALDRLRELRAADRPVAVVMAAAAIAEAPAADFLAQTRSVTPAAKRVLVIPRGGPAAPSLRVPVPLVADRQAATPVLRAIAHGMIDAYLPAPGAGRDEGFHRAVSELLEEWGHDAAPVLPAVRIIAGQQSARAHELRDALARSSIPYAFHAADSAESQSWLAQAGQDGSALPVLLTYTGEVLVDPPNRRRATHRLAAPQIARDEHGFIVTGSSLPASPNPQASWTLPRPPHPPGDQHARRLRRRRRPPRLGQARRLRSRRRVHRHHATHPIPANTSAEFLTASAQADPQSGGGNGLARCGSAHDALAGS